MLGSDVILHSRKVFAALIKFFDGRQPRLTHVPPVVRSSAITEVLPSSCARGAAANAVEPEPRMRRSNLLVLAICIPPTQSGHPSFGTGRSPFSIGSSSLIASFNIFICAWSRYSARCLQGDSGRQSCQLSLYGAYRRCCSISAVEYAALVIRVVQLRASGANPSAKPKKSLGRRKHA